MFLKVNMRIGGAREFREVFFALETDHQTMEEVAHGLAEDGFIAGVRYDTEKDLRHSGRRIVTDVSDFIAALNSIVSVTELRDDLYEADGTPIYTSEGDE